MLGTEDTTIKQIRHEDWGLVDQGLVDLEKSSKCSEEKVEKMLQAVWANPEAGWRVL